MRHLHAGKINYNATSMINEDMMMMVMNARPTRHKMGYFGDVLPSQTLA